MILESILGVATGFLGNIITSFTNLKQQKLKNAHELAMIDAETTAMIKEAEANIKITETKVQGEVEKMETEAFMETLKSASKPSLSNEILAKLFESKWTKWIGCLLAFLLGFVDFLKSLIRPALTIYLVGITSYITWYASQILSEKQDLMTAIAAQEMFTGVVDIVIYLTVSCVTWWFGDRRTAKFAMRLNDGNIGKK